MRGSRILLPAGMACLLFSGLPAPRAQEAAPDEKKPPSLIEGLPAGLVMIPEGDVVVGFSAEAVAKLLKEEWVKRMRADRDLIGSLGGEKIRLPAFFIASHEVTNGQYETFVKAKGHRFPYHWWTTADQEKHLDLFKEASPTEKFDPLLYWEINWEGRKLEWAIPVDRNGRSMKDHPVEWVSYLDALAYCRWAGLRMPTEAEWTRAARGDTDQAYPWGADWEPKRACTFSTLSLPVQQALDGEVSWPMGKLYHMAGNAMEWTASRYLPLPGFDTEHKALSRRKDVEEIVGQVLPQWDPTKAVIKGGSYQLPETGRLFCMIDARTGVETDQPLISAGFRTCKSLWPGMDAFRVAVDLERAALGDFSVEVQDEEETNYLGMEAWKLEEGKISSYHSLGYAPIAEQPEIATVKAFRDQSIEEPVLIGLLFTTESIQEPALEPGFYLVYYRDDRPSRAILAKISELKEKQRLKKTKRGEEPEEPEEEMPDPDVFKLGDLVVPAKKRFFLFRNAETGVWQQAMLPADVPETRGAHVRSTLQLTPQRDQILFQAPVRIRGRSAVVSKLRLTMPQGFLAGREWRLPNMLSKDTYGYAKGWQKKLIQ